MSTTSTTLLSKIKSPSDLKNLNYTQLKQLADEIRDRIINVVSKNGGHLASNLGIVELTLALHRVFNSPKDKIIFDVGHQCYTHKIITGRNEKFSTLRQFGGISGFPKACESEHDTFDTGHASTSISAALGMALARDLMGETYKVVAVIGDGALTGGLALEALNDAGHRQTDLIVILNDNEMSISPNVGALSTYLHKIRVEPTIFSKRDYLEHVLKQIPGFGNRLYNILSRLKGTLKYLLTPGMLFEELGFKYLGPISGYDFEMLEITLNFAKRLNRPVLVHVLTTKGKGYKHAEEKRPKYHGVGPFEISSGKIIEEFPTKTYTKVFGETLVELAKKDEKIVAITAAMKEGTGLDLFSVYFPNRFFDVGIAEEHAVTLAAGMAKAGLKPVVAIYSTFLQRSYDQIIHDVALQNLPVVFCLDRAGIVGEDGPTHHGMLDISYMRTVPNLTVMAPRDEFELPKMLEFAINLNKPVSIRYPRGGGVGELIKNIEPITYGKAEILINGSDCSVWAFGNTVYPAWLACKKLIESGFSVELVNARFAKPLDKQLLINVFQKNVPIITVEENTIVGGFGAAILELANELGYTPQILRIALPDAFIPQGKVSELRTMYGLDSESLYEKIYKFLQNKKKIVFIKSKLRAL